MQHRNRIAETPFEPLDHLRGKRDFRNKHNRLLALLQTMLNRLQIDFRFAAARHAMQQQYLRLAARDRISYARRILLCCPSVSGNGFVRSNSRLA